MSLEVGRIPPTVHPLISPTLLCQFDAVLIHQQAHLFERSLPPKRHPRQRYVFWSLESAQYYPADNALEEGVFNWTMTYRRDSDFQLPYGRIIQTK